MTRSKVLVAALVLALVVLLPSIASAQPDLSHVFSGSAMLNDRQVIDGTPVAAYIEGQQVASASVTDGRYGLIVVQMEGEISTAN